MPWRLLKLRRKSPCTPSDEVADLDSGSGQWMINKHLCNTCMLQISHVHMPGCPSFIYAFVHFFSVVHLNLCTWNLRLCNPAGWVRNCAHRNWISVTDYRGRATLQCCHHILGSIPFIYGGRRGCGDLLTTRAGLGDLNKQAASGEVSPWLTILTKDYRAVWLESSDLLA